MAQKTLFFVQPYVVRKHKLMASGAQTYLSSGEALEAGVDLARRRAGIVVMSQSYDTERQVMSRPTVLRIHGRVPDDWTIALRQAA
ncbi:hypothetical protein [Lichenifustis flavocetrariae]|uniref:Uncharacterized protein n=1 Tax=Lichenifustis flavocetrariae TaxID=2949735 RepID=A0AA41Z7Y2_9HYPH|nr:hypothetical protein [Lichenifustis flavocetrariae]MCW6511965.1 hypothetical protein [Lichenifustis flavocetrariae]